MIPLLRVLPRLLLLLSQAHTITATASLLLLQLMLLPPLLLAAAPLLVVLPVIIFGDYSQFLALLVTCSTTFLMQTHHYQTYDYLLLTGNLHIGYSYYLAVS